MAGFFRCSTALAGCLYRRFYLNSNTFATVKKISLSKKAKIFLNYVLGPAIFVWLSYSIYRQVQKQVDLQQSWEFIKTAIVGTESWKIILVMILMAFGWGIEARKWQLLAGHLQAVSFVRAFKAVLSGHALAFSTPNRIGEPVGRAVFLDEGKRLKGIAMSCVGAVSQVLVAFVMGLTALLLLRLSIFRDTDRPAGVPLSWYNGLIWIVAFGISLLVFAYYRLPLVIKRLEHLPVITKYRFLVEELENFHWKELTGILLLSAYRYVIIMVQYVLLLQVFDVQVPVIYAMSMVAVMFVVMVIVPSIALAELGFRGKISLLLFGTLSTNAIGIIATTAGMWIINLIIPAAIGSIFLLRVRLFGNKKEKEK